MIRFYQTPRLLQVLYPSLVWSRQSEDAVFLTFDDGPNATTTPWVLEELGKVKAKATFFCLGQNLIPNQELVQQMLQEGHLIANHTFSHLKGTMESDQAYLDDITSCDEALNEFGIQTAFFRPPYGNIKKSQMEKLKHKQIVLWSHLSWDFDPAIKLKKSIMKMQQAAPGSILVFHDTHKADRNLRQMLPAVLAAFKKRGLKMQNLNA